jgi:hypothetical protein
MLAPALFQFHFSPPLSSALPVATKKTASAEEKKTNKQRVEPVSFSAPSRRNGFGKNSFSIRLRDIPIRVPYFEGNDSEGESLLSQRRIHKRQCF